MRQFPGLRFRNWAQLLKMDKTGLLRAGLTALRYVGADSIGPHVTNRIGAIFMLHHVAPDTGRAFEPNRILRVTPEFLEAVISYTEEAGFKIISLDEVPDHIESASAQEPFACFTFDDGYKDNLEYALPIFRKHSAPFAIYVPTDFVDGGGYLWWLLLEKAIDALPIVKLNMEGTDRHIVTITAKEKSAAYNEIYWWLRAQKEDDARQIVRQLADEARLEHSNLCRDLVMTWDELKNIASDPLVTIGAHTVGHYALAKLPHDRAFSEMKDSIARLERELGAPCRHFSYPYGDPKSATAREFQFAKELGMKTAVTTQKGLIGTRHKHSLTSLPRLSLNGEFQDTRFVRTLLSGAPFALLDAAKRAIGRPAAA